VSRKQNGEKGNLQKKTGTERRVVNLKRKELSWGIQFHFPLLNQSTNIRSKTYLHKVTMVTDPLEQTEITKIYKFVYDSHRQTAFSNL
jgi:hypothetical protein